MSSFEDRQVNISVFDPPYTIYVCSNKKCDGILHRNEEKNQIRILKLSKEKHTGEKKS